MDAHTVEDEVVDCGNGGYEIDGDMPISDFLELVGIGEQDFEAESETVGGWSIEMYGSFPEEGASFEYEGLSVTVLKKDGLRVEKVLVKRID